MKTLLLTGIFLFNIAAYGQIRQDTSLLPQRPVYNPYQFPNYYQNNSMFNNNSMQTNKPANPFAGPYTGNADYTDPTKNTPNPTYFYNAPNNVSPGSPIKK